MSGLASLILLPQTVYQNDGTVQPMNIDGVPVKAAAFYNSSKYLQTVSYNLSNFRGSLIIQATLDDNIDTERWFNVMELNAIEENITINSFSNVEGNFVYLRAILRNFVNGSVQFVRVAY